MAGRFMFQKFSSRMSRSAILLGAPASASRAGAPIISTAPVALEPSATLFIYRTAVHPSSAVPNNHGIHDYIYCKAINRLKPSFLDSVRGTKRALSSDASNGHEISRGVATWAAEWEAKAAAFQADRAAWGAEMDARAADFRKFKMQQACLWGFTCACWIVGGLFGVDSTSYNGHSGSHRHSGCCNGQCGVENPKP
ncbi:hypothetical protein ACP70R_001169 [Stipagrostis hirtigluma subsp. patula]